MRLRTFQKRFLASALAPKCRSAVLSLPRGNGKSTLAAWLASRALTPGDRLYTPATESHIVSGSLSQARRTTFRLLRELFEGNDAYRIAESGQACHIRHKNSNTRISVLAANPKGAQGLVRCPWIFCDDPGAWEVVGGEAMYDALTTGQGKPNSPTRIIFIGTVAPATSGWWPEFCKRESTPELHVTRLQGDLRKWDSLKELRRVNPLLWTFPESRKVVLDELEKARTDSRLRARFLSYRLNLPTPDEARVLLPLADWAEVLRRVVPNRASNGPFVGIDLGGARAWSAATAVWLNGRTESFAMVGGEPSLEKREEQDKVPKGLYRKLARRGSLIVQDGRRTVDIQAFADEISRRWQPLIATADSYRFNFLRDAVDFPIEKSAKPWRAHGEGIAALRASALDGTFAVAPDSQDLLEMSIGVSTVEPAEYGGERLVKSAEVRQRDDAATALVLAMGLAEEHRGAWETELEEAFVV